MIDVIISDRPLDTAACISSATDAACGGVVSFAGVVRNSTNNKKVLRLEYECYEPMALKEMKKIAKAAIRLYAARSIVIQHRTGILYTGDIAVVIVAGAPHREAAFDACRYAIDTLKQTVPIWKKEVFEDGEEWVSAHA
ncbi:molybdenum cofactor biosynthesis protein MoaE [Niabella ginsenosidivorans]|uniref:Molybdopterin synthase catalytic subunit n=1 Tax=Niabella ginsenosidivorans TaxID=1176587 RepID=A0A1A9HYQ5_9BACT|nr:molybdenum cofactor biosynthesis protein MoaE [Niabella ginsenosidivorans]ANH80516.1 molybdenum cofactor biosynthesis protein MoaE [Niabella ginsenosidivorans]